MVSSNKIIQSKTGTFGLAGEDFCYFSKARPSCYFLVGSAPKNTIINNGRIALLPHHSPEFAIDEDALGLGCSVWI